ncbi:MAG: retropepsin-like aspartic protease, partial [Cyanobacteria bacterium P01_G01_bin.49]
LTVKNFTVINNTICTYDFIYLDVYSGHHKLKALIFTHSSVVMTIKGVLTTVIVITGIIFIPNLSSTQAQQSCFLEESNGQSIDLGHLCGEGSSSPPSVSPNQGILTVPIKRRYSGIPVVDVTFNGKHTFEMLFDTGASTITISKDMAAAMGLTPKREAVSQTAGGMVSIGISTVSSVKVGEVVGSDLDVAINPTLPFGLLGQTFYGHYDVTIKQDTIELRAR